MKSICISPLLYSRCRHHIAVVLSLFLVNTHLKSQEQIHLYPELSGDELIQVIREEFKPQQVLTYAQARDTLYGKIANQNDSISCLYTSYTIYLDPKENPRQDAFNKGINAEHIWPRSLGASGRIPEADLHHILPCRIDINNDRGNLPFEELSVAATRFWYYLDIKQAQVPLTNRERYSQLGTQSFTPAEHMRGDIARSMLYFYTMYTEEALQADPDYFEFQRNTFCKWHFDDPVDEEEWNKTWGIAPYQEDKPNPFILDCSIPERTYCEEFGQTCLQPTSVQDVEMPEGFYAQIYPQPGTLQNARLEWTIPENAKVILRFLNAQGKELGQVQRHFPHQTTEQLSLASLCPQCQNTNSLLIIHFTIVSRQQVYSLPLKWLTLGE